MFSVRRCLNVLLLGACLAAAGTALAQRGGPPGSGGGPGGRSGGFPGGNQPGMGSPGMPNETRSGSPPPEGRDQSGTVSTMRGGLQLGPPGRWWDDKHFAKDLKLRPDQQKRMDSIFEQNRTTLLQHYDDLRQQEAHMEELTHAKTLDETALFAQIDRIAQARAGLEKVTTHLLFQIRNEMDTDQLSRLEQHR